MPALRRSARVDQIEHGGELREQDDLAAFARPVPASFPSTARAWRKAGSTPSSSFSSARIAAGLPQLEQRVEHDDVARAPGRAAAIALRTLSMHRHADRSRRDRAGALQLDRARRSRSSAGSSVATSVLGPAQQKRPAPAGPAPPRAPRRPRFSIGVRYWRREAALSPRKPGHQRNSNDRPQLAEMIFHRRAGQAEAMPRLDVAQPAASSRPSGFLIGLRLVQHHHVPVARQQDLAIAREQRVGGQHQIVLARSPQNSRLRSAPCSTRTRRSGVNFARLVEPVGHQAGRRDDQRRLRRDRRVPSPAPAAPGSARSCRGPYRRPAPRPGRFRAAGRARPRLAPGKAAASARKLSGSDRSLKSRAWSRPARRRRLPAQRKANFSFSNSSSGTTSRTRKLHLP